MKTLNVIAKEWFDKINGNSYFSAEITVDYGMETQKTFLLPFQYGYGNQYETEAKAVLTEFNLISANYGQNLNNYCKDNGVKFYSSIVKNCKKKDLKN